MRREGRPAPDDMIYIEFAPREMRTLKALDVCVPAADPGVRAGSIEESMLGLTWAEWLRLLARIATASPETMPKRPTDLDYLAGHIGTVLDTFVPDLAVLLQEAFDQADGAPVPIPQSPEPAAIPTGPRVIDINTALRLDQVSETPFFRRTRAIMTAMAERGGVKATVAKNLNRAFVREMVETLGIDTGLPMDDWQKHPLNEQDVFPVHIPRIVAEMAGFLRLTKGVFRTTKRGRTMLDDSHAGGLYAELFATFFNKLNLAYLDSRPEGLLPQEVVAPAIGLILPEVADWTSAEVITEEVLPPYVMDRAQEPWGSRLHWVVQVRLLRPLCDFGLMEKREVPSESSRLPDYEYRATALYGEFVYWSPA